MNELKTTALLSILSALLIAISYWVVGDTPGFGLGFGLAGTANFAAWYYSDQIVLTTYRARPASAAQLQPLNAMLQRLCDRANLPMPALYIVSTSEANAFATGRSPDHAAIAVTQGLLDCLTDDEVEAVIAHELSHILHRDTLTQTVAATLAGTIAFLAEMIRYSFFQRVGSGIPGSRLLGMIVTILLAPLAATVLQFALSRTREFAADEAAAKLTQNPLALASALQRLEKRSKQGSFSCNPAFTPLLIVPVLSAKFLDSLFSTHPPTAARVERLQQIERANGGAPNWVFAKQRSPQGWIKTVFRKGIAIAISLLCMVLTWTGLTYNTFNNASVTVDAKWAQVENQLQRRADLIPQLKDLTPAQEREILAALTQSQETYEQAITPAEKMAALAAVDRAVEEFLAIASSRPTLQVNSQFVNLQYEIAGTENRIATERRRYIQAVQDYNQKVQSFPNFLLAKPLGFHPHALPQR
ncbi:MAG: M48 family metalloprotease [Leptolyngbyaceae cyanobacterium SL_5_9]|nr:M48 family metalloprotease [Leptolyngbyaceae cyanobacterium SL_5_9]